MDDRLEIYRLSLIGKLYELSGEHFEIELVRETFSYYYRCHFDNSLSWSGCSYNEAHNPELFIDDIEKDANCMWSKICWERQNKTLTHQLALSAHKRVDLLIKVLELDPSKIQLVDDTSFYNDDKKKE